MKSELSYYCIYEQFMTFAFGVAGHFAVFK